MLLKETYYRTEGDDFLVQIFHSCIAVSDIVGDKIIMKRYIGYTEQEAVELFKQEYSVKKGEKNEE